MNSGIQWLEATFARIPLPVLEVWGWLSQETRPPRGRPSSKARHQLGKVARTCAAVELRQNNALHGQTHSAARTR